LIGLYIQTAINMNTMYVCYRSVETSVVRRSCVYM